MADFGRIFLLIYAALMLAGGIMGYVTKKSIPSLAAGLISGALLFAAFGLIRSQPKMAFGLATLVAIALVVAFWRRYQETGALMPSGMLLVASLVAALVFAATLAKSGN